MKNFFVLFFVLLCMKMWSQTQMNYWALPPHKINLTAASPTATALPGSPSASQYLVSNGAFDPIGNLLFYVRDNDIYNQSGTVVGTLADYSGGYTTIQNEISIVPVPGSCADYYIIYSKFNTNTLLHLVVLYTKVRVTASSITILSNGSLIENGFGGNAVSIAVSKATGTGASATRFLYALGYPFVRKYTINSSGITYTSQLVNISGGPSPMGTTDMYSTELELSDDGSMLAWVTYVGDKLWKIPSTATGGTGLTSVTINTAIPALSNKSCLGLEFKPASNSILYVSMYGLRTVGGTFVQDGGIYKANGSTVTAVVTGGVYNKTQLELGRDGFIYGVNATLLGKLNHTTDVVTSSGLSNVIYSDGTPSVGPLGGFYRLPDQVDGENYNLFTGVPVATYTALNVVNNTTVVTPIGIVHKVLNCQTITLTPTATNYSQYQLQVFSSDASGNKITGAGKLDYSSGWVTASYPATTDLRTLSSSYLTTNTGYFTAVLQVKDACNPVLSQTKVLEVSNISALSSNYLLNYGDGNLFTAGTSYLSPTPTGQDGLGINANSSAGYLDFYQLSLQKVDAVTGAVLEQVCNPSSLVPIANHSPASLGSIPLNGTVKNRCGGPTGYFTLPANVDMVYQLTFTVSNACGSASSVGYFTNTDEFWRIGNSQALASTNLSKVTVFPNPANRNINLTYSLKRPSAVSLKIFNAQGKEMQNHMQTQEQPVGEHTQSVDVSSFPKGVYLYQLDASGYSSGQFVVE